MPRASVIYIGNFSVPFSTETHLARDFERVDCVVRRVDQAAALADWRGFKGQIARACRSGVDLLLYTKTQQFPSDAIALWREVEMYGTRTASFHLDLYRGLDREREVGLDPFWHTGFVFTADGGSQEWFGQQGVQHHWLPAACVSDECVRGTFTPELASDVVFVGKTAGYHKQWPWRVELVEGLRARYGDRFRLWGHGDHMRGQRLNDLYASARVVVGDSLALPCHANYWSDRYYETIGRGGFLVAPRIPGLDAHFSELDHFVPYNVGELEVVFDKVDAALEYDRGRYELAERGRRHVAAHHTYKQRALTMLETVGL